MLTTRPALSLPLGMLLLLGCNDTVNTNPKGGPDLMASPPPTPVQVPGCTGACTVRYDCPQSQGPTTVTGVVSIPAGNLPLYNARVFIPSGTMPPPPQTGASCDLCKNPPSVVTVASTDINGKFTLVNVPSGQHIPLIISVGKWRRVVTLPPITECTTTALDADQTRLPRNQKEGNIPRIALSTGNLDALECILRSHKLGLDDAEFTPESGTGRVNLYAGATGADRYAANLNAGALFTKAQPVPTPSWWDTAANWMKYDVVLLSCEGSPVYIDHKSQAALQNLENFIGQGGRVFASHWHNVWISQARPPQQIQNVATFGGLPGPDPATDTIDLGFDKGQALADWLLLPSVMGSTVRGQLQVNGAKFSTVSINQMLTQRWVYYQAGGAGGPQAQYFSFNAPIGARPAQQCGQMVFTDLHVSSGSGGAGNDGSMAGPPGFPGGCQSSALSAQEKALIFMLFDLTNCLTTPIIG